MSWLQVLSIIFSISILNLFGCLFALGRMHTWLAVRALSFGDNGWREHLGEVHDVAIDIQSKVSTKQ